jgi:hypothetical protein
LAQEARMTPPEAPADDPKDARRSALRFGAVATALLAALVGGFALLARLEVFSAGFHVNFALFLGIAGTILLGVGLMALSFYSDRSGADDRVLDMSRKEWSEDNRER